MSVSTTRSLEDLRAECDKHEISWIWTDGRESLMNLLRDKLGLATTLQLDPMKAADLKSKIDWTAEGDARFVGIAEYLTDEYVAEPKLDGCRMLMVMGEYGNTLTTGRRSVKTFGYLNRSDNFPHIRDAVALGLEGTILDGEVLSPSTQIQVGKTMTNSLLNASVALVNADPEKSVAAQAIYGRAKYYVFDCLAYKGRDLTVEPYTVRRRHLYDVVLELAPLCPEIDIVVQQYANSWSIQKALDSGYEGVMLKRKDGIYVPGKRSKDWLKVKTMSTADAFIVGWAPGTGANVGKVGSLDLAVYERATSEDIMTLSYVLIDGVPYKARPVAQVGNLTDAFRGTITDSADGTLLPEWYGQVIELMGQGVGKNGRVRHPHMLRLRPDKTDRDCLADQLDVFPAV